MRSEMGFDNYAQSYANYPNGPVADPGRYPNGPVVDPGRYPNGPVVDPRRYPNGPVVDPGRYPNGPVVYTGRPQVVIMPVASGGPWGYGWYSLSSTQRNVAFALSVIVTIVFIILMIVFFYNWNKTSDAFDERAKKLHKSFGSSFGQGTR